MKYKNSATTDSWIYVLKVKAPGASEKIVHISHNCRLFRLADFIFHIYNEDIRGQPFEFSYLDEDARSYRGYRLFRLPQKNSPFPTEIGNIRTFRIDSAFFADSKKMRLCVEGGRIREYVIEFLECINPTPRRRYPYVEKNRLKQEDNGWPDLDKEYHSDPSKAKPISRPRQMSLDQVSISKDGEYARIAYLDEIGGGMSLKVEGDLESMTDLEILKQHNDVVFAMKQIKESFHFTPVEVPVGRPQMTYHPRFRLWVPRGNVLRCLIGDGGPDYEATVDIDGQELSLEEFGRLLTMQAGCGMRITFVPNDEINKHHLIEISDPVDD